MRRKVLFFCLAAVILILGIMFGHYLQRQFENHDLGLLVSMVVPFMFGVLAGGVAALGWID
jgi:hypothetical protein